jgi:hypothetical protein
MTKAEHDAHFERELETYYRELPRLIAEGKDGKFAVIKGDQVVAVYDSWSECIREAHERYGTSGEGKDRGLNCTARPIRERDLVFLQFAGRSAKPH